MFTSSLGCSSYSIINDTMHALSTVSFESTRTTGMWLGPDTCSRYTVHGIMQSLAPAWRAERVDFSNGGRPDNTDGPEERLLEEMQQPDQADNGRRLEEDRFEGH